MKDDLPFIIVKDEKDWSRMLSKAYHNGCYFRLDEEYNIKNDATLIEIIEYFCSPEIHNAV